MNGTLVAPAIQRTRSSISVNVAVPASATPRAAARSGEILGIVVRNRPRQENLDGPCEPNEGGSRASVPLSSRAVAIIRQLEKLKAGDFVFPGQARNKPLSNMAMEMVLRRMKVEEATVHGFRSSFRDWAGNVSNFPREVVETALAHVIGDKAEQAYRRSDALEKRRKLMDQWAAYCSTPRTGKVVAFQR
jgi:integrase